VKDTIFRFIDGSIVHVDEPNRHVPWIFRYDRVCMSILDNKDIGSYWFKNFFGPLCKDIANPSSGLYSITDPRSSHRDYYKVKRMESPTELIQIYYHPKLHYKPMASIEFTVTDKISGYANHVQEILRVEEILKKYSISFHVGPVETCLDAPTEQEYKNVSRNLFLRNSSPGKDDFHFINGESNPKTGKPVRRNGFHPCHENKYIKGREASVHLKSYRLRNRIEITFTRNFLKRHQLDYFSEILDAGPILFFNRLDLYTFDLKQVLDFRDKSKRLGRNPGLFMMGPIALRNLFTKTSGEILLDLTERLNWKVSRVKQTFGTRIDFPPFIIDTKESSISYQQK